MGKTAPRHLEKIKRVIFAARDIVVAGHINPDGKRSGAVDMLPGKKARRYGG